MPAPKLKPLSEQVIVVTGATSGIGLATARMAASQGAAVVIVARNEDALNALAAELRAKGGRAEPVVADVADLAQVEAVSAAAITAFGGFDSWCNNAGVAIYGSLEDVPVEDQRRLFDVNYWGVVHGTLVAARHLKGKGGAIVNTGSVLSDRSMALQGPYSASKFAIKGVTEAFRTEFLAEGYPISVTLIKPGPIDTPYMEHARNLMGTTGVRNPPPAYHPRVVARAILYACEHRVRDLTVGGGGLAVSAIGRLAPKLTDLVMSKIAKPTQSSDQPGRQERRDNLYDAREDLAETSSLAGPPPRRTSFLLEAQMNPLGPAGIILGATALLAGAAFGMYTLRHSRPLPERFADRARRGIGSLGSEARRGIGSLGHEARRGIGSLGYEARRGIGSLGSEARRGIGSLGDEASRIAGRALGYAGKETRPYLRGARKGSERFADRASRYAASAYEDVLDRGADLYDEARSRGRSLYKAARGGGEDVYDDARDRGWSLFRRGRDAAEDVRDAGWGLFGRARYEAEKRGRYAARQGEGLLDRLADLLKGR
ncbi:SDR family NAD(P)-dependent oxidoreductase [Roseomonas sp. KE2513]|uniref:SDR family oxidoreductase n=1 Tax=Roseomonas sp. KE2513 TaxID=2479202 RepID=UPI0018E035A9|nr:SDR family oxidoreductase [Roseomonas sp. KE2513]MBI0535795.1 SDR family NAD(P)-dependent oxidoreductase [Roseomonas sp. KE2513]